MAPESILALGVDWTASVPWLLGIKVITKWEKSREWSVLVYETGRVYNSENTQFWCICGRKNNRSPISRSYKTQTLESSLAIPIIEIPVCPNTDYFWGCKIEETNVLSGDLAPLIDCSS